MLISGGRPVSVESLGLENVDNTADTDKPVSTAVAVELDGKIDTSLAATAGDILVAVGPAVFEAQAVGPAGTVLTAESAAVAWAAAGGATRTRLSTPLESGANLALSTTNSGSTSYTAYGLYMFRGTTNIGTARAFPRKPTTLGSNYFDKNPSGSFVGSMAPGASGNTIDVYLTIGAAGNLTGSVNPAIEKCMGFHIVNTGELQTVKGIVSNQVAFTEVTLTGLPALIGSNRIFEVRLESGVMASFFVDGTLCGTISTGLPSGYLSTAWDARIIGSLGTNNQSMELGHVEWSWES